MPSGPLTTMTFNEFQEALAEATPDILLALLRGYDPAVRSDIVKIQAIRTELASRGLDDKCVAES